MNKEDWISLPSGMIINLANVAFIVAISNPSAARNPGAKIRVAFVATYSTSKTAQPMSVEIDEAESKALLRELSRREMDVSALIEKTGIKMIDLNQNILDIDPATVAIADAKPSANS